MSMSAYEKWADSVSGASVKEKIWIIRDKGVNLHIPFKVLDDVVVDEDLLALAAFFFVDMETALERAIFVENVRFEYR